MLHKIRSPEKDRKVGRIDLANSIDSLTDGLTEFGQLLSSTLKGETFYNSGLRVLRADEPNKEISGEDFFLIGRYVISRLRPPGGGEYAPAVHDVLRNRDKEFYDSLYGKIPRLARAMDLPPPFVGEVEQTYVDSPYYEKNLHQKKIV